MRAAALIGLVFLVACGGEDTPERRAFIAQCEKALSTLDCGCFYDDTAEAPAAHTGAFLSFMQSKNEVPPAAQKERLIGLVGVDKANDVWQAAIGCSGR